MDIEYLIIGLVFLITGVSIFVYKFNYHTIKDDEITGFKYNWIGAAILLIILAFYLILEEIKNLF